MATLYELNAEFSAAMLAYEAGAENYIDQATGEIIPMAEYLESLELDLDTKVDNTIKYIKTKKILADGIKAEIDRQKKRLEKLNKSIEGLESYLLSNISPEVKKLETPEYVVKIRTTERAVVPDDEQVIKSLPSEFVTHKVAESWAVNKAEVKKAIKAGLDVAGCYLETHKSLSY